MLKEYLLIKNKYNKLPNKIKLDVLILVLIFNYSKGLKI